MRRQLHAIARNKVAHPVQVVPQLLFIQHSRRQPCIFAQQVPAQRDNLIPAEGARGAANAFFEWLYISLHQSPSRSALRSNLLQRISLYF